MLPAPQAINTAGFALMDKAEAMLAADNITAGMDITGGMDPAMLGLQELRNNYHTRD